MRKGQVGAQLWTAYAPCGSQHKDAVQITLEQIDLIKRLLTNILKFIASFDAFFIFQISIQI